MPEEQEAALRQHNQEAALRQHNKDLILLQAKIMRLEETQKQTTMALELAVESLESLNSNMNISRQLLNTQLQMAASHEHLLKIMHEAGIIPDSLMLKAAETDVRVVFVGSGDDEDDEVLPGETVATH